MFVVFEKVRLHIVMFFLYVGNFFNAPRSPPPPSRSHGLKLCVGLLLCLICFDPMKYKKAPTVFPPPLPFSLYLRFLSIAWQACGRGKRWKPAVELLKTMQTQGLVPDTVSVSVGAVCCSGRRSIGVLFHDLCPQRIDDFSIIKSNPATESWLVVYRPRYDPPLSPPVPPRHGHGR